MIYVAETFRIRPGTIEAFVAAAYALIDTTRRESGCRLYDLHASVTDPDRLVALEQWDSRPSFDQHRQGAAVQGFSAAVAPYVLSSRIEVIDGTKVDIV
ncbi:MAG: antibiotic biosynthesis monooxygenase [Alphaproteobacteria bacterium]|nr:antibiotic biosynthesis monooxygenase [Alphaproteobacteria bacterium]